MSVTDLEGYCANLNELQRTGPVRGSVLWLLELLYSLAAPFSGHSSHFGVPQRSLPRLVSSLMCISCHGRCNLVPQQACFFSLSTRISNSSRTNIRSPQPRRSRQQPLHRQPRSSRTAPRPTGLQEGPGRGPGPPEQGCSTVRTPALIRCLQTRNRG